MEEHTKKIGIIPINAIKLYKSMLTLRLSLVLLVVEGDSTEELAGIGPLPSPEAATTLVFVPVTMLLKKLNH